MSQNEIQQVLANWIERALSPVGSLPVGTTPNEWIAKNFVDWWRTRIESSLGDAEGAANEVCKEITRLGGWDSAGEAMEEALRVRESLADLRSALGLDTPPTTNA
jgi:hypothetical protein